MQRGGTITTHVKGEESNPEEGGQIRKRLTTFELVVIMGEKRSVVRSREGSVSGVIHRETVVEIGKAEIRLSHPGRALTRKNSNRGLHRRSILLGPLGDTIYKYTTESQD